MITKILYFSSVKMQFSDKLPNNGKRIIKHTECQISRKHNSPHTIYGVDITYHQYIKTMRDYTVTLSNMSSETFL